MLEYIHKYPCDIQATTTLEIQPLQLEFLMKDLCVKLEHALIASKRRTFLKVGTNVAERYFILSGGPYHRYFTDQKMIM